MYRLHVTFALVTASLLLTACGGGGSETVAVDPLNAPEKQLVGTYQLQDFEVWMPGTSVRGPEAFELWSGRMELREDRTAVVRMELCEHGATPTASCDRSFAWTAETSVIHLHSLTTAEPDVRLQYEAEGMGAMSTDSLLPTNDPNAGLLLLEDGNESFYWVRVD